MLFYLDLEKFLCVCVCFFFVLFTVSRQLPLFLWLLTIYIIKRLFHILPLSVKFSSSFCCHRTQDHIFHCFIFFYSSSSSLKYLFRFNRFFRSSRLVFFCHLFLLLCYNKIKHTHQEYLWKIIRFYACLLSSLYSVCLFCCIN